MSPAPLGDYLAGPNHVLPTGGSARFASPLGAYDFLKRTSIIEASTEALKALGPEVARLARMEGFEGHARAMEVAPCAGSVEWNWRTAKPAREGREESVATKKKRFPGSPKSTKSKSVSSTGKRKA